MQARLAATCLILEAIVMLFAGMAAKPFVSIGAGTLWGIVGSAAVLCIVAAGLAKRRVGIALGWAVQLLVLASGWWLTAMLFIGVCFGGLYGWLVMIGARIERERAAIDAAVTAAERP